MAMAQATDIAALPDDLLLLHIFARLPDPVDLFRCAGTCRRWLRLISDPVGGLLPETWRRASFPLGAFYQEAALVSALMQMKKESMLPPQFVRFQAAPPGGGRPTFTPFFPNDDGLFNYAKPLASRRGLLLLRIMPTPLDHRKLHLAVCHPMIGERSTHLLPPPPLDLDPKLFGDDIAGYAIVTAADHGTAGHRDNHGKPAFQVLFTAVKSDDQFVYAYSYSSTTGTWSAPIKCLRLRGLTMYGPRAGVVVCGMVHWLYRDRTKFYTLDIKTDSPHTASLTRIRIRVERDQPPSFPCIVGGKLSFVTKGNNSMLELWTKREQDDEHGCSWLCSELMFDDANRITVFGFLAGKGAMLVKNGSDDFFTVDLESKEIKPVAGHGSFGPYVCHSFTCQGGNSCDEYCTYNKLVIHEMDWPSYLLHLSSRRLDEH